MIQGFPFFVRHIAAQLVVLTVLLATASQAEQTAPSRAPPISVLDGKTFTGEIIPSGKTSGRAEDFVFSGGKFHSKVCLEWGFKPGPYWVRLEKGRVHFMSRLTSADNGVMTYQGTIVDSKMDATVDWIKPRWYWTMKRQFRFQGAENKSPAKAGN